MSQPQAPAKPAPPEPTMEEILASIRRIIADNGRPGGAAPDELPAVEMPPPGEGPAKQPAPAPDAAAAEPPDAALVLTRMVAEGGSVLTVAPGERGQGEVIAVEEPLLLTEPLPTEAPSRPEAPSPPPAAATPAAPAAPRWIGTQRTMAPRAAPADSALAPSARPQPAIPQPEPQAPPPAPPETQPSLSNRAGRTIEEIALEALAPMLQAWLDRHLREIVERRVQEEIDRISRKSES
jgi:uncharacterized protein